MAKKLNIDGMQPKIMLEPVATDDVRYIRCRVLIVCEGQQTDPNYFRSFNMMKNSSGLVYEITCGGGGINTMQVVDEAIALRDAACAAGNPYDAVWAVFDRDSFVAAAFDNAVAKAEANDIGCAWSNEAFEMWYVFHFDNRCTPMSRKEYKNVITRRVCEAGYKHGKKAYVYKKNDPDMRRILAQCGCDERRAIRFAECQAASFHDRKYHTHNPCTTVYKLVRLLLGEDKEFIRRVEENMAR